MTWLYWNLSNSINPKAVDDLEARYCFRRLLISINWKDFGYLTIFLWFSLSKISLARVLERSLLSIKGKHKRDFWQLAIKISVRKPRYVYNRTFTKCLEPSLLFKILKFIQIVPLKLRYYYSFIDLVISYFCCLQIR